MVTHVYRHLYCIITRITNNDHLCMLCNYMYMVSTRPVTAGGILVNVVIDLAVRRYMFSDEKKETISISFVA